MDGGVRVVCNSHLSRADVEVARAAKAAMRREWCESRPEALGDAARPRFRRLYDGLRSGRLAVRVLPDDVFGLIHGKAGVITLADGRRTSFLGSANESASAFRLNYELVWEDDAPEAVEWVQQEFDALWSSPSAVELADFIVGDLDRLARREPIRDVDRWREDPDPASPVVEAPVYRREAGLWEHQKYFVKLAFDAHRGPHGARFVLADQVGLGKTLQLAMAAQLMALVGDRPVLVLAPKSLVWQWQGELDTLLGRQVSPRTKSLLLATATPVQLHPIEAYDLLDALARGSDAVLEARWEWWRNPLPPRAEGKDFQILLLRLERALDATANAIPSTPSSGGCSSTRGGCNGAASSSASISTRSGGWRSS